MKLDSNCIFSSYDEAINFAKKAKTTNRPEMMCEVSQSLIKKTQEMLVSMQKNVILAQECFFEYLINDPMLKEVQND